MSKKRPNEQPSRLNMVGRDAVGRLSSGPPAQPEVISLGYIEGAVWRLVVFPPSTRTGKADEVPQLQRQVMGGQWEVVAHDDVLAHVAWQAYRRGRRAEGRTPKHSGLFIPGSGDQ